MLLVESAALIEAASVLLYNEAVMKAKVEAGVFELSMYVCNFGNELFHCALWRAGITP